MKSIYGNYIDQFQILLRIEKEVCDLLKNNLCLLDYLTINNNKLVCVDNDSSNDCVRLSRLVLSIESSSLPQEDGGQFLSDIERP